MDSLGQQLANQGIFIVVEKRLGVIVYDFAHRRFRELLAVQYLDDHSMEREVLGAVVRDDLAEFTFVLMRESRFRDAIFRHLVDGALQAPDRERYGKMLADCSELQIDGFDPSSAVEQFWLRALRNDVCPRFPKRFISLAIETDSLVAAAADAFATGVWGGSGGRWVSRLSCCDTFGQHGFSR